MRYKSILGAGMLGGIGFTMSIFIALLAFDQESMINHSKLAILIGSAISGTLAYITIQYDLVHKR
jgi:NhaA family Na+:H+ antiporter